MRTGYNLAISTAVAAVSLAGFAAVAQLGHLHHQATTGKPGRPSTHWKKETIVRLGPVEKHGLVAEGIDTGDKGTTTWKIRVLPRHNMVTGQLSGGEMWFIGNLTPSINRGAIGTFFNGATDDWPGVYGVVSKDVTRIAVTVGKHQTLNLYPVAAAGRRWVALLTPPGAPRAMTFTAYSGKTVLASGVNAGTGPVTWLLPGQHGLAKQSRPIGAGKIHAKSGVLRWSLEAQAGPWGYSLDLSSDLGDSGMVAIVGMSPDTAKSAGVKSIPTLFSPNLARFLLGTAKPSVAYLKFELAGGRKALRAPAVLVEGQRFFGVPLAHGAHVTSWAAYDQAGHKLYGGIGAPKIDKYVGPLAGTGWANNIPCQLGTPGCRKL